MSEWTEERKAQVVEMYKDANPTADNSTEIVKSIAAELEESANGVRMILMQEKVYIKKGAATTAGGAAAPKKEGEKGVRVSKESQIAALKAAIEDAGKVADDEILSKLTGKAAVYFLSIIKED